MADVLLLGTFVRELLGLDLHFQSSLSPTTFSIVILSAPEFTEALVRPFYKSAIPSPQGYSWEHRQRGCLFSD